MSRSTCGRDLLRAFGWGAAVNLPWELAHSLLYRDVSGFTGTQHLVCCGLAALMDGAGIAAIFGTGAVTFQDARWSRVRSPARLVFTALLGLGGAVATEWLALRLGWWSYRPEMPRVPVIEVGVSPLVQFVILPVGVLYWILPRGWEGRRAPDPRGPAEDARSGMQGR